MNNYVEFNGGKIRYRDAGEGPVVVLIHGFLESLTMWESFVEYLQDSFRVITIDLPGHGLSSNYGTDNSMDFMAAAVKEVLDLLYVKKAVVIGHSMGGYVTVAFARNYPETVSGFGFFHSHAAADSAEAKINRGRAVKVVEQNHKEFISAFIPDLFTPENRIKLSKEIAGMQEEARRMEKEGIIAALNGMRGRKDGYSLLKNTKVPVMFIVGKQDSRAPMDDIKKQIFMPENSHVLILEKVAHMGFLEDFQQTAGFLKNFAKITTGFYS
jgi:pimeloyl-ACP methyl ester carboxylesterase